MNHRIRLPNPSLLLCGLLVLLSPEINAKETDRNQPIHLEADRVMINEKSGTSAYEGNVKLRQGTLEIEADNITVFKSEGRIEQLKAQGKPVHFRQDGDVPKENIRGYANQITYHASNSTLRLNGKAHIWQDRDEFMGEEIIYDIARKLVNARAGSQGEDRVHVIIQPRTEEDKPEK
jgi:lipopolysaccharide export system protein LptA